MRHLLCQDWLEVATPRMNIDQANNSFLLDLQQRLKREDKSLIMYGFPQPLEQHTELERHRLMYNDDDQRQLYEQLDMQFPNNEDQQHVYETIMDAVTNPLPNKRHFFIDGPGGTGKTTIVKNLIASIRALDHIALVAASTTLAATNYDNASSAHSLFNYPVVEEEDRDMENRVECQLRGTERYILLQHCTIIFWEEFISNHKELYEAVECALIGLPIIFVTIGDFRQILPVVLNCRVEDTINSCISSSPVWSKFKRLRLKINIRLQNDIGETSTLTAEALLAIGKFKYKHFNIK
jgi:tRNA A37 threonylcarbamoyladenosine biosynthesis protein TsaE